MSTPFYDLASLVVVPSGYKSGKVYAQKPLTTDGQLTFSRASTATRVNSAGLIETVASNVPRLDYLGSTCPRLLLEPQRTNLALYSESFDNAGWSKAAQLSVTANSGTSPDGTTSADLIFANANSSNCVIFNGVTTTVSTVYTSSLFVKASGKSWVFIRGIDDGVGAYFNVSTGELGTVQAGVTATITNYGNGWYRCTVTQTASFTVGRLVILTVNANGSTSVTASGTDGLLIWGAQVEAGAYATSYIPTLGAAVTRGADAASKTGISSLIGQTEGTLFVDVNLDQRVNQTYMVISSGATTTSDYIGFSFRADTIVYEVVTGSALQASGTLTNSSTGQFKLAIGYKANDFVFYVNGTQIGTDSSGTAPACNDIVLYNSTFGQSIPLKYNQTLLFKTRLTNAQLAELTAL